MPGLMNMPTEIRYQILQLCLLVEGTINPYPALHEDKDQFARCNRKPDVALIKVNKILNLEATEIIYSKNTWQLSSPRPLEHPPFEKDLIWNLRRGRILHLNILMDVNDDLTDTVLRAAREADEGSLDGDQRATFVHDRCLRFAKMTWCWKLVMMAYIAPLTLEIDMKNMYCPTGCCRNMFTRILGIMTRGAAELGDKLRNLGISRNRPTTNLSIVGLARRDERNLLREIWNQDLEGEADENRFDLALRFTIRW